MRPDERVKAASPQETAEYVTAWKAKNARLAGVHMMFDGAGVLPIFEVKPTPGLQELFAAQPEDQDVATYWDMVKATKATVWEEPHATWVNATYEWPGYATISLLFNVGHDRLLLEGLADAGRIGMVLSKEGMHRLEILVSDVPVPVLRGVLRGLAQGPS